MASAWRAGAASIAATSLSIAVELPGEDARQRPAFGAPRLGKRRDGARDAGLERVGELGRCAARVALVLDLDDAAHGKQPVDGGRLDAGRQLQAADGIEQRARAPPR